MKSKDIALHWIREYYPKRHDGKLFDPWDGKYPSFISTRQYIIKMYIRLYRNSK